MESLHKKNVVAVTVAIIFGLAVTAAYFFESSFFYQLRTEDHNSVEHKVPIGEITSSVKVSQLFFIASDDFSEIDVQVGTYARNNSSHLKVALFRDTTQVFSKTIDAQKIQDNGYERIRFARISDSGNSQFRLDIWSDDATAGNAVTLWKNDQQGELLLLNGQTVNGSLNYKIHYKEFSLQKPVLTASLLFLFLLLFLHCQVEDGRLSWRRTSLWFGSLLFIEGVVLLALRNAEPFFFPILYAEDGSWTSLLLLKDFWQAVPLARSDFPVLGLMLLMQGGLSLSQWIYGYDLTFLPSFYALFSYAFMSVVALTGYFTFRKYSRFLSITVFLFVLLIPLGEDGNEVIGRILNLGFLFPTLTVFCLLQRWEEETYNLKVFCIDVVNLISCLTLPVGYGLIGIYLLLEFFWKRQRWTWRERLGRWALPLASLMVLVVNCAALAQSRGGASDWIFVSRHFVEFAIGRTIVYPFLSGYWTSLSDGLVLLFFTGYLVLVVTAGVQAVRRKSDGWFVLLLSVTAVYAVGLVVPRAALTALFHGYTSTFPDRYFYGLNILTMTLLFSALHLLGKYFTLTRVKLICVGVLVLSIFQTSHLFEFERPVMNWRERGNLQQLIREEAVKQQVLLETDPEFVVVPVYPVPWKVALPVTYVKSTAASSR